MRCCALLALLLVLMVSGAQARLITDMTGRQVEVPERIERVIGSVSPVTWMIYAIDPSLLAAVNSVPSAADLEYLCPNLGNLPVIGGFGATRGGNREALLALHPDVVVFWGLGQAVANRRQAQQLETLGIPVVFVELDRLEQYAGALRFLGDLLNRRDRAEQLANYGERALAAVRSATADIPAEQRVRVYYAEGMDGLSTEPYESFHAELIPLAGGINVHQGGLKHYFGRDRISLEQVLLYDPQVLLVQEKGFFNTVHTDARWQKIRAVRDGRVWFIPDEPLNWFDRPPSFMRFLGLQWLAHRLYPQRFSVDLHGESRRFYRQFLGVELDESQLEMIAP